MNRAGSIKQRWGVRIVMKSILPGGKIRLLPAVVVMTFVAAIAAHGQYIERNRYLSGSIFENVTEGSGFDHAGHGKTAMVSSKTSSEVMSRAVHTYSPTTRCPPWIPSCMELSEM